MLVAWTVDRVVGMDELLILMNVYTNVRLLFTLINNFWNWNKTIRSR